MCHLQTISLTSGRGRNDHPETWQGPRHVYRNLLLNPPPTRSAGGTLLRKFYDDAVLSPEGPVSKEWREEFSKLLRKITPEPNKRDISTMILHPVVLTRIFEKSSGNYTVVEMGIGLSYILALRPNQVVLLTVEDLSFVTVAGGVNLAPFKFAKWNHLIQVRGWFLGWVKALYVKYMDRAPSFTPFANYDLPMFKEFVRSCYETHQIFAPIPGAHSLKRMRGTLLQLFGAPSHEVAHILHHKGLGAIPNYIGYLGWGWAWSAFGPQGGQHNHHGEIKKTGVRTAAPTRSIPTDSRSKGP